MSAGGPEFGLRARLDRVRDEGLAAEYRAQLTSRDHTSSYRLELERGGDARVSLTSGPARADDALLVAKIGRSLCKGADWPRRVTRWRDGE